MFVKVLWDTFIGSLKNLFIKGFFKEPWFERFFVEPKMVLLWHHSEEPFLVPGGTFMVLCDVVRVISPWSGLLSQTGLRNEPRPWWPVQKTLTDSGPRTLATSPGPGEPGNPPGARPRRGARRRASGGLGHLDLKPFLFVVRSTPCSPMKKLRLTPNSPGTVDCPRGTGSALGPGQPGPGWCCPAQPACPCSPGGPGQTPACSSAAPARSQWKETSCGAEWT